MTTADPLAVAVFAAEWALSYEGIILSSASGSGASARRGGLTPARGRCGGAVDRLHRTPTWTLLLVGRRCREWGYLDPDGTWTRYDLHEHAREFDAAMAARKAAA